MPLLARLVVAALAGIAAGAAFEPFGLVALLPIAVAALTLTLRGVTKRRGFVLGTGFGTAFMLTLLPWMQVIGADAWIMLSVFQAFYYGLLGATTVVVLRLPWWPLWAAALWVAVEMLRSTVPFGGFPWGRLAYATVDTPVADLFTLTGAAGATFAVALVGTSAAWAVAVARRTPVRAAAAVAAAAVVAVSGSLVQPQVAEAAGEPAGQVTVAAVQGDVPGEGMDAFAERRAVLNNHVQATRDFAGEVVGTDEQPDLVIWPENSTDIDPFADPTVFADIQGAVDAIGVPVLVGAMVSGTEPSDVLNQGIVWEPGTGPGERYSKTHPVPFGEYIPFRDVIAKFFTRLDQIPRDMVPGTRPGVLPIAGTTIGDVICFEVAYDELVRDVVNGGADLLVVQTNNATYMGTGQVEQQFAIARLRAIETHRYVVVAATNGVSGIIAPSGEVVARAETRTQAVLLESLPLHDDITAGVRWGSTVGLLLTLVAAGAVSAGIARHRRRRRTEARSDSTTTDPVVRA